MDVTALTPPAGQRTADGLLCLASRLFSGFRDVLRSTFGLGDSQATPASDGGPSLYLAAFGKHPGWDDHIDDLGLETDLLIRVKQLLYIEGIASNLDKGSWDELAPPDRLEKFNHD